MDLTSTAISISEIDEPLTLSFCSSNVKSDDIPSDIEEIDFNSPLIEEPIFTSTPKKRRTCSENSQNSKDISELVPSEIESIVFEESEIEGAIEEIAETPIDYETPQCEPLPNEKESEEEGIAGTPMAIDYETPQSEPLPKESEDDAGQTVDEASKHSPAITKAKKRSRLPKKASATDLFTVKQQKCCGENCLKEMDLVEMCIIRKDFDNLKSIQKRQTVLSYLWSHAKADTCDLKDLCYYLSGFKLCLEAYRLVLGLSEAVVKDCIRDFHNGTRELVTSKDRRTNLTEKRLHADIWMERYFKRVGDKMPDTGTIHLPSYLDKKLIYQAMAYDLKNEGNQCIHYSSFCHNMKTTYSHVKIPKVNRFTRCDYCTVLREEKTKARDKDVKRYLDNLFAFHNALQMSERKVYYKHRGDAKKDPKKCVCILLDGMDQAKLLLPRLSTVAHAYANARQLRTHLTGVLNHGRQPKGYFDLFQYPHDANLTINILLLELQEMDHIPETLFLQMDNCWRENKNQFVINFMAILVKLDIFKKVHINFLMVGHTHEDIDQLFNRVSEYITKRNTRSLSELMKSLERCYTPAPKAITVTRVYKVKEWFSEVVVPLHNISNPHAFKIVTAPSGNVVMQYKNWAGHEGEQWKPDTANREDWITLIEADTEINIDDIPDLAVPNLEKVELPLLRNDIGKFFRGSRVFTEELKTEWTSLLAEDNEMWAVQDKPATWPLQDIVLTKQRQREEHHDEATVGFMGERPAGVPEDVDDMVQNQIASIPEVYTGPYRRPEVAVAEVNNFDGIKIGMRVAVHLENYKPPNIARVVAVAETQLEVSWLKGGYYKAWIEDRKWGLTQIPRESIIFYDFEFDQEGKLTKDAARFLRSRYKSLKKG